MYQTIFIIAATLCLNLVSCAQKNFQQEKPPCTTGINSSSCDLSLNQRSSWKYDFTITTNPQSPSEIKRSISVYYEFTPSFYGNLWRRTLLIQSEQEGLRSMVQSGRVLEVSQSQIKLVIDNSSCNLESSSPSKEEEPIVLFYLRTGSSLEFSSAPLKRSTYSFQDHLSGKVIADTFGKIAEKGIGLALRQLFSFGDARAYLESQNIDLKAATPLHNDQRGELGCFHSMGSDFIPYVGKFPPNS